MRRKERKGERKKRVTLRRPREEGEKRRKEKGRKQEN